MPKEYNTPLLFALEVAHNNMAGDDDCVGVPGVLLFVNFGTSLGGRQSRTSCLAKLIASRCFPESLGWPPVLWQSLGNSFKFGGDINARLYRRWNFACIFGALVAITS